MAHEPREHNDLPEPEQPPALPAASLPAGRLDQSDAEEQAERLTSSLIVHSVLCATLWE